MRVAFPLLGSRVSPRPGIARAVLLATVEGRELRHREERPLLLEDEQDLVERMLELSVSLLVCGGIARDLVRDLEANGIAVMSNVAGEAEEALQALREGRLGPGWGLRADGPAAARRDVAAGCDPRLCRIAELVHFGLAMGYRRVGLAFCRELFHEVGVLVPVLRRFFEVVPVCCRVGAGSNGRAPGGEPHPCNPALQARLLEAAGAELNVAAGLCMGTDLIFAERSHVPVTTLFVKDRSLAHNPIGAIYTRYHLEGLGGRAP